MGRNVHIAIVGGSGSGKTWLADRLSAALAPDATRVSLDDFYRDLSPLPPLDRAQVNFDEPNAIDWDCVRGVMGALSGGETAEVPGYDFATHTRQSERWRRLDPRPFVIWDGLWLLQDPWLRGQFALRVYVDCPPEERLARRIARDVRERGRTEHSVRRQFREQVEPMHLRHVEPQRSWADCCVVSPPEATAVEALIARVQGRGASAPWEVA